MKITIFIVASILALALLPPALADGISGTYVHKSLNSASLLQVVQSGKNKLDGRYEQVVIQTGGVIAKSNFAFSGSVDGKTVVGTLTRNEFLPVPISVSGTIDGAKLHLTGGKSLDIELVASPETEFSSYVAALQQRADGIKLQIAEEHQLDQIDKLTRRLNEFVTGSENNLYIYPKVQNIYTSTTHQMRDQLARERTILGSGQRSVARAQISTAIYQKSNEAAQAHVDINSLHERFVASSNQNNSDSVNARAACGQKHSALPNLWQSRCEGFNSAFNQYVQIREKHQKLFSDVEQVWLEESKNQELIKHDSEVAINQ